MSLDGDKVTSTRSSRDDAVLTFSKPGSDDAIFRKSDWWLERTHAQTYVHTRKKAFTREWQWDVQLSANTSYAARVCHCNVHRLPQRTVVTTTTTTTIPENSRVPVFPEPRTLVLSSRGYIPMRTRARAHLYVVNFPLSKLLGMRIDGTDA